MYTAQGRHTAKQTESAYVFDQCRLTADPRTQGSISLGRPWRPYATVVFLHAQIDAPVIPAGWTEWVRFGKPSLPTAFYAEYESTGPGANSQARDPHSHQLTAAEAGKAALRRVLAGPDKWNPDAQKVVVLIYTQFHETLLVGWRAPRLCRRGCCRPKRSGCTPVC